jgi:hypothetical protein
VVGVVKADVRLLDAVPRTGLPAVLLILFSEETGPVLLEEVLVEPGVDIIPVDTDGVGENIGILREEVMDENVSVDEDITAALEDDEGPVVEEIEEDTAIIDDAVLLDEGEPMV